MEPKQQRPALMQTRKNKVEKFEIEIEKEGNVEWQNKRFLKIHLTINGFFNHMK